MKANSENGLLSAYSDGERNFARCQLVRANLSNAPLTSCDLSGADLRSANLSNADLSNVKLCSADLSSADLTGADLSDADLTNASLRCADLRDAVLTRADLTQSDLTNAEVAETQLDAASCVPLCRGYHRREKITSGGMADVFVGVKLGVIEKRFVIKRITRRLANQTKFLDMFQDEARIYNTLEHPNIIRAHDFFDLRGNFYIAMEYVKGINLRDLWRHIKRSGPLPVETTAFMFAQICAGLHHAHTRIDPHTGAPLGIIHRDISPSNILISQHGEVKLIDFGVAKAKTNLGMTGLGERKGKPSYMSPEQALGDAMDHQSDIFSVGCVLYELCTGRRVFRATSEEVEQAFRDGIAGASAEIEDSDLARRFVTLRNVLHKSPPLDRVPLALRPICRQALEKIKDHRYRSAQEMEDALHALSTTYQSKVLSQIVASILKEKEPLIPIGTLSHVDTYKYVHAPVSAVSSRSADEARERDLASLRDAPEVPEMVADGESISLSFVLEQPLGSPDEEHVHGSPPADEPQVEGDSLSAPLVVPKSDAVRRYRLLFNKKVGLILLGLLAASLLVSVVLLGFCA